MTPRSVQAHEELEARHATIEGPAHSAVDRVCRGALRVHWNRHDLEAFTDALRAPTRRRRPRTARTPPLRRAWKRTFSHTPGRCSIWHRTPSGSLAPSGESRTAVGLRTEHQQSVTPEGNEYEWTRRIVMSVSTNDFMERLEYFPRTAGPTRSHSTTNGRRNPGPIPPAGDSGVRTGRASGSSCSHAGDCTWRLATYAPNFIRDRSAPGRELRHVHREDAVA